MKEVETYDIWDIERLITIRRWIVGIPIATSIAGIVWSIICLAFYAVVYAAQDEKMHDPMNMYIFGGVITIVIAILITMSYLNDQ